MKYIIGLIIAGLMAPVQAETERYYQDK